jgi:glutaredoxin-like protein
MQHLNDSTRARAKALMNGFRFPVRMLLFTQELECRFCRDARVLAEEIAGLSDKLSLEVYDLARDASRAAEFKADKAPAFCVAGDRNYGFRYFGVPAGFEFTSLLAALEVAGARDSVLKPETRRKLAMLAKPVDVQLFVTLSCPACPSAAALAARFAVETDKVSVSVIDSAEFPDLADLYDVMTVPKAVINRGYSFQGVRSEEAFVDELLRGASQVVAP